MYYRDEALATLDDLSCEDTAGSADETFLSYSRWVDLINQGGLCVVSDEVYTAFQSMELAFQEYLQRGTTGKYKDAQPHPLGLSTIDSLVTLSDEQTVLIPVQNFEKCTVELPSDIELGVVEPFDENDTLDSVSPYTCTSVLVDGPGYYEKERPSLLLNMLDLSESDCTSEQLDVLKTLLSQHTDIFEMDSSELSHSNVVQHVINTGDSAPSKQHPYRTPIVQKDKTAQFIKQMEQQGIVKPSCSPWASPVVLVPKKDGSTRFCLDYCRLNTLTKNDVYPLPRIDDILDTLGQAKYFITLDLSAGYWQVELDSESQAKTTFTSHCGLYEFTHMPFGLCNPPAIFQCLMQVILSGLEWNCCFIYIDNILVTSQSFKEHMNHLQLVFERLRQAGLHLKPKKCLFLREKVPYLGCDIQAWNSDKVKNFPTPTDPTSIRSFVGLALSYRQFVPHFTAIAAPLHRLTKKDVKFEWSEECETAHCQLKSLLTEAPMLVYPCFGEGEQFLLETDASGIGLGAVLSQKQSDGKYHPVAYASRSLQPNEKNYPISELETLAIVWAVKYFHADCPTTRHRIVITLYCSGDTNSSTARTVLLVARSLLLMTTPILTISATLSIMLLSQGKGSVYFDIPKRSYHLGTKALEDTTIVILIDKVAVRSYVSLDWIKTGNYACLHCDSKQGIFYGNEGSNLYHGYYTSPKECLVECPDRIRSFVVGEKSIVIVSETSNRIFVCDKNSGAWQSELSFPHRIHVVTLCPIGSQNPREVNGLLVTMAGIGGGLEVILIELENYQKVHSRTIQEICADPSRLVVNSDRIHLSNNTHTFIVDLWTGTVLESMTLTRSTASRYPPTA